MRKITIYNAPDTYSIPAFLLKTLKVLGYFRKKSAKDPTQAEINNDERMTNILHTFEISEKTDMVKLGCIFAPDMRLIFKDLNDENGKEKASLLMDASTHFILSSIGIRLRQQTKPTQISPISRNTITRSWTEGHPGISLMPLLVPPTVPPNMNLKSTSSIFHHALVNHLIGSLGAMKSRSLWMHREEESILLTWIMIQSIQRVAVR
jgi:hypothetical protein